MVGPIVLKAKTFISWIKLDSISNHSPIFLQLDSDSKKANYPFECNHSWIREKDFIDLVHKVWKHIDNSFDLSSTVQFMYSLRDLKDEVSKWEK